MLSDIEWATHCRRGHTGIRSRYRTRLKVAVGLSGIALLHSPNLPHTYINDVLDVCSHHSQLTPHTASHTLHHSPNTAVHHPSRFCRHLRVTFITAVSSALTLRACPVSDTPSTVNTHPLTHHSRVYRNVIILATTGAHTAAALTADCRLAADTSVTTTASTGVRSALNSFLCTDSSWRGPDRDAPPIAVQPDTVAAASTRMSPDHRPSQ